MKAPLLLALATVFCIALPSTAFGATAFVEIDAGTGERTLEYGDDGGETNQVEITHAVPDTTIRDEGAVITAGPGCTSVNAHEVSCPDIDFVRVELLHGDDEATVLEDSPSQPSALGVIVSGSFGNDKLSACDACSVRFIGGSGNDILTGGPLGDVTFVGNGGKDILTGNPRFGILNGGDGDDTITGGDRANLLKGGGGDDRLFGRAGSDVLKGLKGDDVLVGGSGHDTLKGQRGDDVFRARDGMRDVVLGGLHLDRASVDGRLDDVAGIEIFFVAAARR